MPLVLSGGNLLTESEGTASRTRKENHAQKHVRGSSPLDERKELTGMATETSTGLGGMPPAPPAGAADLALLHAATSTTNTANERGDITEFPYR